VNAHITLHICYGNRYGKPSFEGSYQFLFPAILEAKVQAVSMEFARRGEDDLELFKKFNVPFQVANWTGTAHHHTGLRPRALAP
jgi:5-methyltetrahydropteroyltriglutamate--homocysteine methyltransferase